MRAVTANAVLAKNGAQGMPVAVSKVPLIGGIGDILVGGFNPFEKY